MNYWLNFKKNHSKLWHFIPPKNPVVLSNVLKKTFLLKDKKSWKKKCDNTRSRILQNFNLDRMMDAYRSVWKKSKLF